MLKQFNAYVALLVLHCIILMRHCHCTPAASVAPVLRAPVHSCHTLCRKYLTAYDWLSIFATIQRLLGELELQGMLRHPCSRDHIASPHLTRPYAAHSMECLLGATEACTQGGSLSKQHLTRVSPCWRPTSLDQAGSPDQCKVCCTGPMAPANTRCLDRPVWADCFCVILDVLCRKPDGLGLMLLAPLTALLSSAPLTAVLQSWQPLYAVLCLCRNPDAPQHELPGRAVWAVPPALLARDSVEDVHEACELALGAVNVVGRTLSEAEKSVPQLRHATQQMLQYAEVGGAGSLWDYIDSLMTQPPPPRYANSSLTKALCLASHRLIRNKGCRSAVALQHDAAPVAV